MDPTEREGILHTFSEAVTMPPREYEAWLRTRACKEAGALSRGFTAADGRRTARLLRKSRDELSDDDVAHMRRVAEHVRALLDRGPADSGCDVAGWRDALRNAGHDPARARGSLAPGRPIS